MFLNFKAAHGRTLVVMQKQYWWYAYTGTAPQQLCQLVIVMQER